MIKSVPLTFAFLLLTTTAYGQSVSDEQLSDFCADKVDGSVLSVSIELPNGSGGTGTVTCSSGSGNTFEIVDAGLDEDGEEEEDSEDSNSGGEDSDDGDSDDGDSDDSDLSP